MFLRSKHSRISNLPMFESYYVCGENRDGLNLLGMRFYVPLRYDRAQVVVNSKGKKWARHSAAFRLSNLLLLSRNNSESTMKCSSQGATACHGFLASASRAISRSGCSSWMCDARRRQRFISHSIDSRIVAPSMFRV